LSGTSIVLPNAIPRSDGEAENNNNTTVDIHPSIHPSTLKKRASKSNDPEDWAKYRDKRNKVNNLIEKNKENLLQKQN